MTTPSEPGAPRRVTFDVAPLLEMPIELIREAVVRECPVPGTASAHTMSRLLAALAGVLMHGKTRPDGTRKMVDCLTRAQATRRAVELLEIAESLDGLGPRGPEGAA